MTAVDWLAEKIQQQLDVFLPGAVLDNIMIEQAKAMEKEQIESAWDNGFANGYDLGKHDDQPNPDDAEQYYNKTFKSK